MTAGVSVSSDHLSREAEGGVSAGAFLQDEIVRRASAAHPDIEPEGGVSITVRLGADLTSGEGDDSGEDSDDEGAEQYSEFEEDESSGEDGADSGYDGTREDNADSNAWGGGTSAEGDAHDSGAHVSRTDEVSADPLGAQKQSTTVCVPSVSAGGILPSARAVDLQPRAGSFSPTEPTVNAAAIESLSMTRDDEEDEDYSEFEDSRDEGDTKEVSGDESSKRRDTSRRVESHDSSDALAMCTFNHGKSSSDSHDTAGMEGSEPQAMTLVNGNTRANPDEKNRNQVETGSCNVRPSERGFTPTDAETSRTLVSTRSHVEAMATRQGDPSQGPPSEADEARRREARERVEGGDHASPITVGGALSAPSSANRASNVEVRTSVAREPGLAETGGRRSSRNTSRDENSQRGQREEQSKEHNEESLEFGQTTCSGIRGDLLNSNSANYIRVEKSESNDTTAEGGRGERDESATDASSKDGVSSRHEQPENGEGNMSERKGKAGGETMDEETATAGCADDALNEDRELSVPHCHSGDEEEKLLSGASQCGRQCGSEHELSHNEQRRTTAAEMVDVEKLTGEETHERRIQLSGQEAGCSEECIAEGASQPCASLFEHNLNKYVESDERSDVQGRRSTRDHEMSALVPALSSAEASLQGSDTSLAASAPNGPGDCAAPHVHEGCRGDLRTSLSEGVVSAHDAPCESHPLDDSQPGTETKSTKGSAASLDGGRAGIGADATYTSSKGDFGSEGGVDLDKGTEGFGPSAASKTETSRTDGQPSIDATKHRECGDGVGQCGDGVGHTVEERIVSVQGRTDSEPVITSSARTVDGDQMRAREGGYDRFLSMRGELGEKAVEGKSADEARRDTPEMADVEDASAVAATEAGSTHPRQEGKECDERYTLARNEAVEGDTAKGVPVSTEGARNVEPSIDGLRTLKCLAGSADGSIADDANPMKDSAAEVSHEAQDRRMEVPTDDTIHAAKQVTAVHESTATHRRKSSGEVKRAQDVFGGVADEEVLDVESQTASEHGRTGKDVGLAVVISDAEVVISEQVQNDTPARKKSGGWESPEEKRPGDEKGLGNGTPEGKSVTAEVRHDDECNDIIGDEPTGSCSSRSPSKSAPTRTSTLNDGLGDSQVVSRYGTTHGVDVQMGNHAALQDAAGDADVPVKQEPLENLAGGSESASVNRTRVVANEDVDMSTIRLDSDMNLKSDSSGAGFKDSAHSARSAHKISVAPSLTDNSSGIVGVDDVAHDNSCRNKELGMRSENIDGGGGEAGAVSDEPEDSGDEGHRGGLIVEGERTSGAEMVDIKGDFQHESPRPDIPALTRDETFAVLGQFIPDEEGANGERNGAACEDPLVESGCPLMCDASVISESPQIARAGRSEVAHDGIEQRVSSAAESRQQSFPTKSESLTQSRVNDAGRPHECKASPRTIGGVTDGFDCEQVVSTLANWELRDKLFATEVASQTVAHSPQSNIARDLKTSCEMTTGGCDILLAGTSWDDCANSTASPFETLRQSTTVAAEIMTGGQTGIAKSPQEEVTPPPTSPPTNINEEAPVWTTPQRGESIQNSPRRDATCVPVEAATATASENSPRALPIPATEDTASKSPSRALESHEEVAEGNSRRNGHDGHGVITGDAGSTAYSCGLMEVCTPLAETRTPSANTQEHLFDEPPPGVPHKRERGDGSSFDPFDEASSSLDCILTSDSD